MHLFEITLIAAVFIWLRAVKGNSNQSYLVCRSIDRPKNMSLYNISTHECKNGKLRQRTTTAPPRTTTTAQPRAITTAPPSTTTTAPPRMTTTAPPRTTTTAPPRTTTPSPYNAVSEQTYVQPRFEISTKRCQNYEDVVECTGQKLCKGFKCCGTSKTYHPDFSSCCTRMGLAIVHKNAREKDYVCCPNLNIYKRGSQTCLVAANNDPLWKPKQYKAWRNSNMCYKYTYLVRSFIRNTALQSESKPIATIRIEQIRPAPSKGNRIIEKTIQLDIYSPKRNIKPGQLILQTNYNRGVQQLFFFYSNDELYKLPRKLRSLILRSDYFTRRLLPGIINHKEMKRSCNFNAL